MTGENVPLVRSRTMPVRVDVLRDVEVGRVRVRNTSSGYPARRGDSVACGFGLAFAREGRARFFV